MFTPFADVRPDRSDAGRSRWIAAAVSLCAHLAIVAALLLSRRELPPTPAAPGAVSVELVEAPPAPTPAATPAPAPSPAPKRASPSATPKHAPAPKHASPSFAPALAQNVPMPSQAMAAPKPAQPQGPPAIGAATAPWASGVAPGEGQLAGGAFGGRAAGGGGGAGGVCDMTARIQAALRRDTLVQAALGRFAGGATVVWNGAWVRSAGEDGAGLAAVREAIMWEVAFAPPACRAQPVRGVLMLSVAAWPGAARVALGVGEWRWSDLLRS
jgi:hypothetical protein